MELIDNAAREELLSRCVNVNEVTNIYEFQQHNWCKEFKEIDESFANGYPGIALVSSVNKWSLLNKLIDRNLIDCGLHLRGFHMGRGLPIFLALKTNVCSIDYQSYLHSSKITIQDKYDIYHGAAGDLLTTSVLRRSTDGYDSELKELERTQFEWLTNYLDDSFPREIGYAHGALGMAYALLNSNLISKRSTELIEFIVLKGMYALETTNNYAVCSGPIAALVLSKIGANLFNESFHSASTEICLYILERIESNLEKAPLNLCCGVFGVIDALMIFSSIGENKKVTSGLIDLVSKIDKSSYSHMMDTGLFFGVSGPAHILEQIRNPALSRISFMFPS
ncbi:lanthionine synthetase LanC family protein [Limnohabitans sp.]|jgi:hypothetical protein|uniref:lanthionine synthetase LanC family protein n=1 Tax=Limnohabitans sp. TaxID=1907725 RepID=UPI0037C0A369